MTRPEPSPTSTSAKSARPTEAGAGSHEDARGGSAEHAVAFASATDGLARARRRARASDRVLSALVHGCALVMVLLLVAMLLVVAGGAMPAVREYGLSFVASAEWQPNERQVRVRDEAGKIVYDEDGEAVTRTEPATFGAAPFVWGTASTSVIALVVAVPLSLGAALFIVRVAPRWRIGGVLAFLIEFLAAVPSLAFGIWGVFVMRPFLADYVEPALRWLLADIGVLRFLFYETRNGIETPIPMTGRDMLAGGLILAVMIIPIITAVSRDVLRSVPRAQLEGALALGATWWQSCRLMLRYGRPGLLGAVMLGLARAAGETMAVTLVIGNVNQVSFSPFAPAQTMSSLLANDIGESNNPMHMASLYYVALILLAMSLTFNVIARWLVVGSRRGATAV